MKICLRMDGRRRFSATPVSTRKVTWMNPGLSYMSTVMDLTRIGLGTAWKDYDESFRKAREVSPAAYPWDRPPQMLWMGAVASGVATSQAPDRRGDCSGQARRRPAPRRPLSSGHALSATVGGGAAGLAAGSSTHAAAAMVTTVLPPVALRHSQQTHQQDHRPGSNKRRLRGGGSDDEVGIVGDGLDRSRSCLSSELYRSQRHYGWHLHLRRLGSPSGHCGMYRGLIRGLCRPPARRCQRQPLPQGLCSPPGCHCWSRR